MIELGKEGFYTAFNFSKSLLTKNSQDKYREVVEGNNGSIIVVRGFGKKPSLPEVRIKSEMRRVGIGGVFAGISPENEMLDSYLPELHNEIERFDNKVILVGLSLGGLIALRYTYKYGWTDKVGGVITIASPLNGINALQFTNPNNEMFKDLKPQSKALKEIRETDPLTNQITHFFAKWDEFVGDPNKINTTGKKIILPIGGHNNFLCNKKVSASVMRIVTSSFSSSP